MTHLFLNPPPMPFLGATNMKIDNSEFIPPHPNP